ncbi:MAG: ATP-binding domain-containing protein [Variovorax sp.]
MALSDGDKREYTAEELAVLGGVIDYADRMLYEETHLNVLGGMADSYGYVATTQAPAYRLLRKNAYAKTVVIDTELQGRLTFRLSPNEATYPNASSGYCTPHSPQGRLVTFVQPGYQSRSKLWGDYRVVEVRSFERFGGPQFEPNVRNFLRMGITGEEGAGVVQDLRSYLDRLRKPKGQLPRLKSEAPPALPGTAEPEVAAPVAPPPVEVPIVELVVVDEPDLEVSEVVAEADDEWNPDSPPAKLEDYYGLSERFFTHQTAEQNQIIARSPIGPMFVEGVAGSGKTSAALGRTKMLTTFNAANVVDEKVFRDILGQGQDYWSAEYAGQFSQESCVGFVRTGELIQYLQETCRRIDLPDLPVHEFKELQTRLRDHRKLTYSPVAGRRWVGLPKSRDGQEATTIAWLRAADQAMARRMADQLQESLPALAEVEALFQDQERQKVSRVVGPALSVLRAKVDELADELRDPPREGAFALDRLALRLVTLLSEVRKQVMGSKLLWTTVGGATLYAAEENSLARQLVDHKAALFLRTGQRLVFVDGAGPVDHSLQLRTVSDEPIVWNDETKAQIDAGQVIVRDASGQNFRGVVSDVGQLYLRLLPEATERIFVQQEGALKRLPREAGWGRVKLKLVAVEAGRPDDDEIDDESEAPVEPVQPGQARYSTPDAVFNRLVRRGLLTPIAALPDLYLDTLHNGANHFPKPELASMVHAQLASFKLADDDIDLLLCIGHLLSRGLKQGGLAALREAPFYQAVFVDEVQDFTEQQVFLMIEQANPRYRAITVVGDLAQKLHHGSTIDVRACFPGHGVASVKLTENLRQGDAPALALFSALFRAHFHGDQPPAEAMLERVDQAGVAVSRPQLMTCATDADMDNAIIEALRASTRTQTVAVLFPTAEAAVTSYQRLDLRLRELMIDAELSEKVNLSRRHVRHFADVANAKGLEFDVVVLANVDQFDLHEPSQVNRLYVGVTRARRSLSLLTSKPMPSTKLAELMLSFDSLSSTA